jgi:hypothetical protein
MKRPGFAKQTATLHEIQKSHARTLVDTGLAQRALSRRFDDAWFQDAAMTSDGTETKPVVMVDDDPHSRRLYVHLGQGVAATGTPGSEVSIATVLNPGSPTEVLVPEDGFTMEDVRVVQALAEELTAMRSSALPNLSSDLLAIYSVQ